MYDFNLIKEILIEQNVEAWILYSDEHSDYIFEKYICDKKIVASCAVVTQKDIYLIIHELEKDNIINKDYKVLIYGKDNTLIQVLNDILIKNLLLPEKIHLNFTTINDTQTDNLGHGIYEYLTGSINKVYKENGKKVEFSSAENIIYALFDRKSDKSIARLKKSAEVALKILEEAFKQLKEGLTELEIVNLVHSIFENTKKDIINNEIIDLDYSWRKEFCPIVLVGPSLLKGGHALASNQKLQRGHTIYFDFGVTFYWRESA